MTKIERSLRIDRQREKGRLVAALVVLAIGFMLLAPDPHDHGDAGSLGGLLRLLLPGSGHAADAHQSEDDPQSEADGSCPIHFWHLVAATGLLIVCMLRLFLGSFPYNPSFITWPSVTDLGSFHSRAPPVFLS
jgi:hypothetical protein